LQPRLQNTFPREMQALACGVSVPNFMAFDEVEGVHKPLRNDIEDDGSTSAGSSDIEDDGCTSPLRNSRPMPVYLMGALSCAAPNTSVAGQKPIKKQTAQGISAPPGLAPPPGLGPPPGFAASHGFAAPPGLPPPPGLLPPGLAPPPGLSVDEPAPPEPAGPFEPKKFRRELVSVLKDLAQNKNVAAAVRRVRAQQVPSERQAAETMDILTRAAEENRGNPRRLYFAFVAGLARGSPSAFEQAEVLSGIKLFFQDIYVDLCEEVPRLPSMIEAELVPTLREVFPVETVESLLPPGFKIA